MPVENIPNPAERGEAAANGGNGDNGGGGGGGGGGCSNSNSHNRTQVVLQDIRAAIDQLARTLPRAEGGTTPTP
jgi:hypothetical protein